MSEVRERNSNGFYYITDTIHYEYEYHHEGSRKKNKRSKDRFRDFFYQQQEGSWMTLQIRLQRSSSLRSKEIPTIVDNPIKCLGKWFDETLKDNSNLKTVQTQVAEWLMKVDKRGLPGKFKACIYQHGLLPRLTWLLVIYEMTATTVEAIERKIISHLRRWLGVPPSFIAIGLYSRSS
ncbi:unnamed protein product [Mytilus coruscus]|uniref:Reverse transcriptase domain-containing protein n=1 Tax=Mytilus coruscus TaxID=42192 RepID=A0A6J8BHE7_MYTCO|nr:unnamed protein product [Mytilus coruscus]